MGGTLTYYVNSMGKNVNSTFIGSASSVPGVTSCSSDNQLISSCLMAVTTDTNGPGSSLEVCSQYKVWNGTPSSFNYTEYCTGRSSGATWLGVYNAPATTSTPSYTLQYSCTGAVCTFPGLTVSGTLTTSITGSTQCLHVNSSGVMSGTGSDCGSGGTAVPPILYGYCSGTATSSTTLQLTGIGGAWGTGSCAAVTTTNLGALMPFSGTLSNLTVVCGTTGVSSSSGVFTVYKQAAGSASASSTALTVTYGTTTAQTAVQDTTDTVSFGVGDTIQIRFTTQASETLANCRASVQY